MASDNELLIKLGVESSSASKQIKEITKELKTLDKQMDSVDKSVDGFNQSMSGIGKQAGLFQVLPAFLRLQRCHGGLDHVGGLLGQFVYHGLVTAFHHNANLGLGARGTDNDLVVRLGDKVEHIAARLGDLGALSRVYVCKVSFTVLPNRDHP
mgnify:CR=1 FL=1